MHGLFLLAIGALVGAVVGTLYGRKLEQKAVGVVLYEFGRISAQARNAVADLEARLPWLSRHLHL